MSLPDFKGVLKDVRVGDTLKVERVVKVTDVEVGHTYRTVQVRDVKTGRRAAPIRDDNDYGTLKVTRVKRAKPKAGDVINGQQLNEHMWKRGTVVEYVPRPGVRYMLTEHGTWTSTTGTVGLHFSSFLPSAKFKILYVA